MSYCHQGPGFIPSWQSPCEHREPGWGGLYNSALIAASAHAKTSGSFLSPTAFVLFVGKGQFDGFPFRTRSWLKWTELTRSFVPLRPWGWLSLLLAALLNPDCRWKLKERRNRPACTHLLLPPVPTTVQWNGAASMKQAFKAQSSECLTQGQMLGNTGSSGSKSSALLCQTPSDVEISIK